LELSESSTQFRVIGLQLGVVYVSRAAQKEDRGLTVGRNQFKVLAGDDNIKATETRKSADWSHRIAHKSAKNFGMYEYKFCYTISPVRVSAAI
jgi:hypothetical protein